MGVTQSRTRSTRKSKRVRSSRRHTNPAFENALLDRIERHLSQAEVFTREDVLQLPGLQDGLASVSRYRWVADAIKALIENGRIIRITTTELALPGRTIEAHADGWSLVQEYEGTVIRHLNAIRQKGAFSVMDIVQRWRSDPHLTVHVKRVTVRRALANMARNGAIDRLDNGFFTAKG